MFGYISRQTDTLVAQPRRSPALDILGDARSSSGSGRQALGLALVSLGQRVAGEMPATMTPQPEGDCA